MMSASFRPVVYLKEKCPFCFKVRLFLLEAGLLDGVDVQEFTPETNTEQAIRAELAQHLEKVSFPAAQVVAGRYLTDSDAIIAYFAQGAKVDPARMPVLRAYVEGPFQRLRDLRKENMDLKQQLA
jgi:glutathione S-transferase